MMLFYKGFLYKIQMLVCYRWLVLKDYFIFGENIGTFNFALILEAIFSPKTINWNFWGLAFSELALNQFKTMVMSCSKQFSITDRLGLDLYKVLSSAKLQMSDFSINIMRLFIKILNMRGRRIEPWGIPVKISIH